MARRKVKKKNTKKKKKKKETKENNGIYMIIGMKRTKYIFIYIYLFFRKFQPITSVPDNSSLSSYQDTNQFLV